MVKTHTIHYEGNVTSLITDLNFIHHLYLASFPVTFLPSTIKLNHTMSQNNYKEKKRSFKFVITYPWHFCTAVIGQRIHKYLQ